MAEVKPSPSIVNPENGEHNEPNTDINSPASQQKKRKYEEATEEEKHALNTYHLSNPQLKQRELAEWFKKQYGKSINQSTVSRNLKKFKASNSPVNKPRGPRPPQPTPIKRKPVPSPQKKIQITKQLPPLTPSAVSLPPTPPPRDSRTSLIDSPLYEFYLNYRKSNPEAPAAECDREIKAEAQKLMAGVRPPPPPEKIDDQLIDDAWMANWKRNHGLPIPSSNPNDRFGASTSCSPNGAPLSEADRTCSEETEPRSPVSTVSSIERRPSLELPPMKCSPANTVASTQQLPGSSQLVNGAYDRESHRRKIELLKEDIEKRDRRIEHEQRKKESSLRKLEKLEALQKAGSGVQ